MNTKEVKNHVSGYTQRIVPISGLAGTAMNIHRILSPQIPIAVIIVGMKESPVALIAPENTSIPTKKI